MKRLRTAYILPAVFLLVLGTVLGMQIEQVIADDDALASLQKLEDAFFTINRHYVDDVDASDEAESAIRGMLEHLDPHSTYISAEEIQEVRESYQGSFGGIGIWYEVPDDTARVISTISEGPSEKVGLLPGDRIVAVDGDDVVGMDSDDLTGLLKGEIGTRVDVTVVRPGAPRTLDFTITRDRIPLYTVDTSYMLDDETGFIKVSRFASTTYDEFVEALDALRAQGMERLVVDLRDNPGGVMESAVRMVDELLDGGRTIVYTKGREADVSQIYRSTPQGSFEQEPVIVLVNPYSASASEIMAGALQDHDRALIVGQRTFGKGLVQQQFPLSDGSVLQMTVSRYYTPSGRLIQTPYENGDQENYYKQKFESLETSVYDVSEYLDTIPDSLTFETTHGRTVFGGGGIMPDFVVAPDTTSAFNAYAGRREIFDFVRTYFTDHETSLRDRWTDRTEAFVDDYAVSDAMWNSFTDYLAEHVEADDENGRLAPAGLEANRPMLETLLKAYLGRQLYSAKAWYPIYNQIDPVLNAALRQWDQARDLSVHHSGR